MSLVDGSSKARLQHVFQDTWADESTGRMGWILFVAYFIIFANIPYWIASTQFGFLSSRGVFCVESVMVGLLALIVRPALAASLLFLVICADLVCGVCESFYLTISGCFFSGSIFHALSGPRRLAALIVMAAVAALSGFTILLRRLTLQKRDRKRAAVLLLTAGVCIVATDVIAITVNSHRFPNPFHIAAESDSIDPGLHAAPRFARIPVIRLLRIEYEDVKTNLRERQEGVAPVPVKNATAIAMTEIDRDAESGSPYLPNLVLVVVESWGLAQDSLLRNALVEPYLNPKLQAEYEVLQGTVPFYGATIAGEARELCGNSLGFGIIAARDASLRNCVPGRLAAHGFRSVAVHGMNGHMFQRSSWYERIGFRELWFNEQLRAQGLPDCIGAFVGTCDSDIASWIGRRLDADGSGPYFVDWMTLNSHLPVLVPAALPDATPCSKSISLTPGTPLCSWYQLVLNVHVAVSRLALSRLGRPTIFVVVGDHAPPFGDLTVRNQFSGTDVPYVVLSPRDARGTPTLVSASVHAAPAGR